MNIIYLPDFKQLQNGNELLNPSRFWCDLMQSRVDITQKYGENLLRWTSDMRKKLNSVSKDVSSLRHFLDTYISSTEMEAFGIISNCYDLSFKGGPIHSLKKLASSNPVTKYEKLIQELDTQTQQHRKCLQYLQDIKEKELKAIAATSTYGKRITEFRSVLEKVGNKGDKSKKKLEARIRSLESKLKKQTEKEQLNKLHYEGLIQREHHMVQRLKKTSDHACQEACDLQGKQIDALISTLREFVVKADPLTDNKNRSRPLLDILDRVTISMGSIVNRSFDLTSKSYVFPDVQVWHEKFGVLERLPTPVIIPSNMDISQNPQKCLTPEIRQVQDIMSSVGQPMSSRKPWVYRLESTFITALNNKSAYGSNQVYIGSSTPRVYSVGGFDKYVGESVLPELCTLNIHSSSPVREEPSSQGIVVRKNFTRDKLSRSFGKPRRRIGGPKRQGFFPADRAVLSN